MRTREDVEKLAQQKGWQLNPSERIVNSILKRENVNFEKYGQYYCPCKPDHIPENVCNPCVGSPSEIAQDGHCHCNLFVDPNRYQKIE